MDNRYALIVDCKVTQATGTGERAAVKAMAAAIRDAHQKNLDADQELRHQGNGRRTSAGWGDAARHAEPQPALWFRHRSSTLPRGVDSCTARSLKDCPNGPRLALFNCAES